MLPWGKKDLNQAQMDAIEDDGNVFVVACPGSGKTRALTYKTAYELTRLSSRVNYIAAITYTRRAANEIHERIAKLGVDTNKLWIGTIHSFCLEWILKPYSIYSPDLRSGFRLTNSFESQELLTSLCKKVKGPKVTYWDCGYHFEHDDYALQCTDDRKHESLDEVFKMYFAHLKANKQIDFELLLYYSCQLIASNPIIANTLSYIFPLILVDEYQDTKQIQYKILAQILSKGAGRTNAFVVGDPNQSIYGSLGGYAIDKKELEEWSGLKLDEHHLEKNYRSSERIINYYQNFRVYPTSIEPASELKDYASLVTYDLNTSKDDLENEIVRLIKFNIEDLGIPPSEVCVVAPWWMHLASMTRHLVARLPEYSFDGPGLVPFARDRENFWYKLSKILLTEPSPRIYLQRLRWVGEVIRDLEYSGINIRESSRRKVLRYCNEIDCNETNGLDFLQQAFDKLFDLLDVDWTTVPILCEHRQAFFDSSEARIQRMIKEGAPFADDVEAFRKVFKPRQGITVSSIHGTKGAEFDTVIAYAILEDIVPHSSDANGEDSARKLLYVTSSRARKNLHIFSETERFNWRGDEYVPTEILSGCDYEYDEIAL